MINGIHHTSFTVSDLERSVAFYRDMLGMKVIWDSVQAGIEFKGPVADAVTGCPRTEQHIVYLGLGESLIELVQYMPSGRPLADNKASDTGSCHVCFRTENILQFYKKLVANKVRVHCAPQTMGPLSVLYFRDPDGIILEVIEGGLPM